MPCQKRAQDINCDVDCEVTDWSAWSLCDRLRGVKQRSRKVSIMNKNGGAMCPMLSDYLDCMVHCEAGAWAPYERCIASGPAAGTARRTRPIIYSARNGGRVCALEEVSKCATTCEVSVWQAWSACDVDLGTRFRKRSITVAPTNCPNLNDCCPILHEVETCQVDCRCVHAVDLHVDEACVSFNTNLIVL
jgi:hypothetical protein